MKKIAILTSGGDAPGMNACLGWIIKSCQYFQIQPFLVFDGYQGLFENKIMKTKDFPPSDSYFAGGTIIRTSRFMKFKDSKIRKQAANNLKAQGISVLIVIGGNGSFIGANLLTEEGIQTICIPGTIDNNIANTQYSIGFLTAVETASNAIKSLRETAQSHGRCYIIETMGDNVGALTKMAAVASQADIFSTPENFLTITEIAKLTKELALKKQRSIIIAITEKMYDDYQTLISTIEKESGYYTRLYSLSFLQRGGSPTAIERYNCAILAYAALQAIIKTKESGVLSLKDFDTCDFISQTGMKEITIDSQILQSIAIF